MKRRTFLQTLIGAAAAVGTSLRVAAEEQRNTDSDGEWKSVIEPNDLNTIVVSWFPPFDTDVAHYDVMFTVAPRGWFQGQGALRCGRVLERGRSAVILLGDLDRSRVNDFTALVNVVKLDGTTRPHERIEFVLPVLKKRGVRM